MKKHSLFCAAALISGLALASAAPAAPVERGSAVRAASDTEGVHFEVYLPLRNAADLDALIQAQQSKGSPQYHQWLTPAQFAARFGPTQASMTRAEAAIRAAGLTVTATAQPLVPCRRRRRPTWARCCTRASTTCGRRPARVG